MFLFVAGALSEDVTRKYFKQIVCAVDYCHQKEVYHRDLKLENILLSNDMVKITDFGMAKVRTHPPSPALTRGCACAMRVYYY